MDQSECSICDNAFDGVIHRPRTLPCGHGFCTQCIDTCIHRGSKTCPICRENHGASSAIELPVSFLLEDLLHKAAISAAQKGVSDSTHEEGSLAICPKHKGIPLYFHCNSHNIKVCHRCAVIDHPPTACHLISIGEEINQQSQIVTVQRQKHALIDTENDLRMLLQKNINDLTQQKQKKKNLEREIVQINQEVLRNEKTQEQINYSIQECQKKGKSIETIEDNLKAAAIHQDIAKECEMATAEILQSLKWEETMRKELNMKKERYAQVERNGTRRSCKVLTEGERTFILSLSKEVNPPCSAKLIQEVELGLNSSISTVWMDLSALGRTLGRVFISVMGDRAHGRQFIMLALGSNGPTLKGATFAAKNSGYIGLHEYVTETWSRSHEPIITTMRTEHYDAASRGMIFPVGVDTTAFWIMTKNWTNTRYYGYFGSVINGMEVIDRIASDEYDVTDIYISECGIVLSD
ncbi:unnamed protein product [Meganyctiphanes norvegica]|uniref:RING-type domain-containing protein n=1 Tax=Meganyctiphanes norvegica TaxID=48144 RepID=A0AAV2S8X4_MEGNR